MLLQVTVTVLPCINGYESAVNVDWPWESMSYEYAVQVFSPVRWNRLSRYVVCNLMPGKHVLQSVMLGTQQVNPCISNWTMQYDPATTACTA